MGVHRSISAASPVEAPFPFATIGAVVDRLGTADFERCLPNVLHELASFDSCVILSFTEAHAPKLIDHRSRLDPDRFQRCYMRSAYRLDPFYQAALARTSIGIRRCADLVSRPLPGSAYFDSYYKDVPFVEEIGMLCAIDDRVTVHISLGRLDGSPPFEDGAWARLHQAEPLLSSLIRKHAALRPEAFDPLPADRRSGAVDDWLRRCNATRREIEVASLVLRGHTNGSIALHLGISEDTVKVHRKRLYGKLSISSQAELFLKSMAQGSAQAPHPQG